jgi:hypothetical protein
MAKLHRGVATLFVAISVCFALAALTSLEWVVDRNVSSNDQHVYIGLQQWVGKWNDGSVTTTNQKWSSDLWSQLGFDVYLGDASDWKSAGMAALALGALGVAFNFITLIVLLTSFIRSSPTSTYLATFPSFLSGFCFILGAIIYEGVRPAFHGNVGYSWAFGLYVTSGIASDIAAYVLHTGSGSDMAATKY